MNGRLVECGQRRWVASKLRPRPSPGHICLMKPTRRWVAPQGQRTRFASPRGAQCCKRPLSALVAITAPLPRSGRHHGALTLLKSPSRRRAVTALVVGGTYIGNKNLSKLHRISLSPQGQRTRFASPRGAQCCKRPLGALVAITAPWPRSGRHHGALTLRKSPSRRNHSILQMFPSCL